MAAALVFTALIPFSQAVLVLYPDFTHAARVRQRGEKVKIGIEMTLDEKPEEESKNLTG